MNILIVSAGARAAGKTYLLSHLAHQMPQALLIEQHPYYADEKPVGLRYRREQHLYDAWRKVRDRLELLPIAIERIRGTEVVMLAAGPEDVVEKVGLIQAVGPRLVISAQQNLHLTRVADMLDLSHTAA